jgi:hypothetical protein
MAYCTYTQVQLECGTAVGTLTTSDITDLITRTDAEIGDILTLKGLAVPGTSTYLTTASIAMTIAKIKRRQAHELSRPNSLSVGGDISFSANVEAEALLYDLKGKEAINRYISSINKTIVMMVNK